MLKAPLSHPSLTHPRAGGRGGGGTDGEEAQERIRRGGCWKEALEDKTVLPNMNMATTD